ncbi:hypothetical protein AB0M44_49535 [Streptosporangium subroseum]|uniref:hypothetical protein n=1 Tax=Streptosporangium subroseum TaxID=106412 RepID=UPI003440C6AB
MDDAVATQDTVTQLIAAIRQVVREVGGTASVAADRLSSGSAAGFTLPGNP